MNSGKKRVVSNRMAVIFIALLVVISVFAVVINQNIRKNTIYVNGNAMIMGVGQEYDYPSEDNTLLHFKSYDENVVKVNREGKFTAVSKGSALVKVGANELTVYVEDAPSSLAFSQSEFSIGDGEKYVPKLEIENSGCNVGFEYSSSDNSILSVDSFGEICGVSTGTVKLSVKSYNGLTASCSVTVADAPEEIEYPYSDKTVYLGTTCSLSPYVSGDGVSKTIKITSDNDEIVKTDGKTLIPVAEGKATVTAETYNGKTASCTVNVVNAPYYIRTNLDPSKPMVALSFDDGPHKPYTMAILDVLEDYNASATFFIVGSRLYFNGNDSCAKRMTEIGCQLGNHTYTHEHYGHDVTVDDITKCEDALKDVTGYPPTAYRPTGGYMSDVIKENCNAPIFLWSVDTNDWSYRNADALYDFVMYDAEDGDIILMHDIYSTSATAVEKFVPALVDKGFQIVNIAELAYYKGAQPQNGEIYESF